MESEALAIVYCDKPTSCEGDPCVRGQLVRGLRQEGYAVTEVRDLARLAERSCECGVLLLRPEQFEEAAHIAEGMSPPVLLAPVVDLQRYGTEEVIHLWNRGAADVIPWPIDIGVVTKRILGLQQRWRMACELKQRRQNYQLLTDAGADFDHSADFEEALAEALQRVSEVAGAARCLAMVLDDTEKFAFLFGASDDPTAIGIPLDFAVFSELTQVIAARQPRYEREADFQPRLAAYDPAPEAGGGALLVHPLLVEGEAFGALEFHLPANKDVGPVVLEFIRGMASLLAPRIRLSMTYQALGERTRRRHAEAVARSRGAAVLQRHRDFYERASDGVVVLDPELRVLYLNPMGEQITGYAVSGVAGRPFVELIPEPQREPFANLLADIEQWQSGQVFDLPLRTTSGDPIIVSVSTSASAGGEELRVLSFRDITEARALSEELRHTKEFLERLIDSTVDAIVAADVEGRVILFNQGAERVLGFREAEVLGTMTFAELFPEGGFEALMEQLRSPTDGGVGRLEVVRKEILNAEREVVPVRLSASIIYENGVEMGTVAVISDLRERLHIERRLVQAQERLVDVEKQALIAELAGTTAHELNQPLTSVMGYAQLLQRRISEDDSNHHAAEMVVQECERIAEIVRKIGKITRYETKEYVGRTQILDLDKASEDV